MDIKNQKYYNRCVEAGMCNKGKQCWGNIDELINLAKQECEFIINKKPLSHKEMLSMFAESELYSHNVFIDEQLETLIESKDENITSLFLGCTGTVRLFEDSNIINIADESKLQVKIFSDGVVTIRLYTGSEIDLFVENSCTVFVFNYGGVCNIKSVKQESNIIEKRIIDGI